MDEMIMWAPSGPVDITGLNEKDMTLDNLANLRHVTRAWDITGARGFTVTDHAYISSLICAKLLSKIGVSTTFRFTAITACTFHDCEEAFMGDVATPLKTPALRKVGDSIRDQIFGYLGIGEVSKCHTIVKFCDICSLIYEIKSSGYPHYNDLFIDVLGDILVGAFVALQIDGVPTKTIIEVLDWLGIGCDKVCLVSSRVDEVEVYKCGK